MFIVFEGIDGCGKSTQAELLRRALSKQGRSVLLLREPGSTPVGEQIRSILKNPRNAMTPMCELMLFMAARAQLVARQIDPAIKAGKDIVCDRFIYSSAAYQGEAGGLGIDTVMDIGRHVVGRIVPDRVFILDLPVKDAMARLHRILDRIERRQIAYHERVRRGFLKVAKKLGRRARVLDARLPQESLHRQILEAL